MKRVLPLAAITALACALRLWRIDTPSGWAPEIQSVYVAALSIRNTFHWLIVDHKNYLETPLYYVLLHWWFDAFGAGVLQARLLSVCFGVLAVPATYLLAMELVGKRVALLASLILTVSQAGVVYSQEARPYSLLVFLAVTTCYLFIRALRERRAWLWWLAALSAAASVVAHPFALFVIGLLLGLALAQPGKYRIPWTWWAGAALVLTAPAAAWVALMWDQFPITTEMLVGGDPTMFGARADWRQLGSSLVLLNGSKWFGISGLPLAGLTLVGVIVVTLPALYGCVTLYRAGGEHREAAVLLSVLCVVPVAGIVALGSLGFNKYFPFDNHLQYVVLCAGPYFILVGAGLSELRRTWLQAGAIALFISFSAVALAGAYVVPFKADYRGAVASLAAEVRDGDCVLFYPRQYLRLGHRYGPPQYWHVYNPQGPDPRVPTLESVLTGDSRCRRVWFVWVHGVWTDGEIQSRSAKQGLERALTKLHEREFHLAEFALFEAR